MKEALWLCDETRTKVRDCIVSLEASSGAEVVATVCRRSGHYRHADYLVGAFLSLASLLFYLLYPEPLLDDVAVVIIVASFGVGAVLSSAVSSIRRILLSNRLMTEAVHTAACAHFVDQGVSRTRARSGILVYVSLFERRVEVIPDVGIPTEQLGARWVTAVATLNASARKGVDQFLAALRAFGPMLSESVPRSPDDINELPDAVVEG